MERLFKGKVVPVASAASAMRHAVAFSYAVQGVLVIVFDIAANATVNKIKANGGNVVFIKSNVSKHMNAMKCSIFPTWPSLLIVSLRGL